MIILELKPQPIKDFEPKYEICPDGRVWNKGKNTFKKCTVNPNGYMKTLLALNGKRTQVLIHQVVAKHFLPNPYQHKQVNHIDGDKTNNHVHNLEWVSSEDNIQYSLEIGLRGGFMSIDDKRKYLDRVFKGEVVKDIAEQIGRHSVTLSKMLRTQAERDGKGEAWTEMMKERRRNAALRNLEKINSPKD